MAVSDRRLTWSDVENKSSLLYDWRALWSDAGYATCITYQKIKASLAKQPLLNAASSHDPNGLAEFGAINMDVQLKDRHTGHDNSSAKNFVHGTVMDMPFENEKFASVILGEFLEHCSIEAATKSVIECRRVLKPGGSLYMTLPLDGRPKWEQAVLDEHPDEPAEDTSPGVTPYHQTWWSNRMLADLAANTEFTEIERVPLVYALTCVLGGWGLTWIKR